MAKFCTKCGNEIANDISFCSSCGEKLKNENANANNVQQIEDKPESIANSHNNNSINSTYINTDNLNENVARKHEVVSTGYFFGMILLYAIPIIGWLICLITAFASKNENKKHFARAILIWLIIGIIFSVILFFVFSWIADVFSNTFTDINGEMNFFSIFQGLGGLENIGELQNMQTNGNLGDSENLGDILEQLKQYENMY